jgi:Fe-S cluster assembly iron-binding protein IscA
MLAMTENARDAIKEVAPGQSGLRVYAADLPGIAGQQTFQVEVASRPAPEDDVIDVDGAQVFLDPRAAALLGDKVLDATVEGSSVRFAVGERA